MTGENIARKIIKKLEEKKDQLKSFGVMRIGLFGSYLHGRQKKASDIDLLVTLDESGMRNYIDLRVYLDKLFRKKVDLIIEKNLLKRIEYVKQEAQYARWEKLLK